MLPFTVWCNVFRIPWIRENRKAVHFLSDTFYLLLALYREHRLQDFNSLKYIYFSMIDSFAQYGKKEAKDTIDQLLLIPWFHNNRGDVYRMIMAYNQIIDCMLEEKRHGFSFENSDKMNKFISIYIQAFKMVINFDAKDEMRIINLQSQPETMSELLQHIMALIKQNE